VVCPLETRGGFEICSLWVKETIMKKMKAYSAFFATLALLSVLGCASTATKESTGEYVDDSAITTKVKAAIFHEPTLSSAEIKVETFKGEVQLSGFVSSESNIAKAVEIAGSVQGVRSVKNDMQSK
jgi:hyperosmotically inducible protein